MPVSRKRKSFSKRVSYISTGNIIQVSSYKRKKPKGKRKVVAVEGYKRRKQIK